MSLVQSCWAGQAQLLQAQGLTEADLQQTWRAVCSSIVSSLQSGRGHKVPALCTILPSTAVTGADLQAGQQGIKVLLSDQLLKVAPQLQLGKGCVHHASVRQQVQGIDTVNTAKLAHRIMQGLGQEAIKLALRVLTDTVAKQLKARQACTVDLGVGQLRFSGGAALADFTANASWQRPAPAQSAVSAASSAGTALQAGQLNHGNQAGFGSCRTECQDMQVSTSNQFAAPTQAPAHTPSSRAAAAAAARAAAIAAASKSRSSTTGLDVLNKPSNCDYNAVAAWEIAREVRTAAAQNARVQPARFVLPAGGPNDDGAGEPRMPQGKGKVSAQATLGQQEVVAAAALRLQQEKLAHAAQEAATLGLQAARISALNQQAQANAQRRRAQKQQLAADLTQQMRDKATRGPGKREPVVEQALVVSGKPDAAVVRAQKLRQQAEYRSYLDAQNASQWWGPQLHVDQSAQQAVREQHRQMVRSALGAAHEPNAYA